MCNVEGTEYLPVDWMNEPILGVIFPELVSNISIISVRSLTVKLYVLYSVMQKNSSYFPELLREQWTETRCSLQLSWWI